MQQGVEALSSTASSTRVSGEINVASSDDKTSSLIPSRTIDDDDAALAGLVASLKQTSSEITGKAPSASEAERWRELGEVLSTELRIAAGRTNVSSVPSFFAEHLRRRLWNKDKRQLVEEKREEEAKANPEQPTLTTQQLRECPDCFGTGMYYPEGTGFGKSVARCKHERLKEQLQVEQGSDTTP
jgi:hypothetical protein